MPGSPEGQALAGLTPQAFQMCRAVSQKAGSNLIRQHTKLCYVKLVRALCVHAIVHSRSSAA